MEYLTDGLLRVVPGPLDESVYHKVIGTKVLLPDGTALPAVTKVTLIACANTQQIWKARIECHVAAPELSACAQLDVPKSLPWWRKALLWLAGARELDVTDFDSTSREYRRVRIGR